MKLIGKNFSYAHGTRGQDTLLLPVILLCRAEEPTRRWRLLTDRFKRCLQRLVSIIRAGTRAPPGFYTKTTRPDT